MKLPLNIQRILRDAKKQNFRVEERPDSPVGIGVSTFDSAFIRRLQDAGFKPGSIHGELPEGVGVINTAAQGWWFWRPPTPERKPTADEFAQARLHVSDTLSFELSEAKLPAHAKLAVLAAFVADACDKDIKRVRDVLTLAERYINRS